MNSCYPKTLPDAEVHEENNRRKQITFLVIFDSIVIACDALKAQNSSILLPLYHTDVAFALLLVEDQF